MAKQDPASRLEWLRSVVERYEGPLIRYAMRFTGDVERARDIVQETFLRLCAEGRQVPQVAEWLFTVCRNRAVDVLRKESRMSSLSQIRSEGFASRDAGPGADLERREALSQVLRLLETIPGDQQEVIRLKFQNGFSYREISGVTGLSVSNVGFLMHTGLKTLRQRVRAGSGLPPSGTR